MKINDFNFMVGGKAGEGVDLPGALFARLCMHAGLRVHGTAEFYSVIKGYNNIYQVRTHENQVTSHLNEYDLVLALDTDTTDRYLDSIVPDGAVIYDPKLTEVKRDDIHVYAVPMRDIAKEKVGLDLAKNIVGIGAVVALLDYPMERLIHLISEQFAKKGEVVIKKNVDAAQAGYDFVKKNITREFNYQLRPLEGKPMTFMVNGNEATCIGAIRGGCKFVSEYPMTPSSSILHCMAKHAHMYDISVNHVEDELAAANMAIGAGYAGVRSMAATSGGGFALMNEAIGMAGMIEAPVVLVEVQRPGPSTGLPTRSGQGDLRYAIHASQGEFPKIVLSPGTHEESTRMAFEAFNLAEVYQCPVVFLTEKYLAESRANIPFMDMSGMKVDRGKLLKQEAIKKEGFKRFEYSEDGISNRTIPGQTGGAHTASSYEHREDGYFTEEVEDVVPIFARRMKKLKTLESKLPKVQLEGEAGAEITLVCWGATYGPALEALEFLKKEGVTANMMHVKYLHPLQPGVRETLEASKHPILVEGNHDGQLGGLIAERAGIEIQDKILDWSGRPFTSRDITKKVLEIVKK